MGKNVLFVCQEPTFLVKSMVKTLDESGYHTIPIQPTMVDLSRIDTFPDIFMIYLEDDITGFEATLKFLKGKMVEDSMVESVLMEVGGTGNVRSVEGFPHK